jgi:uncharacterized protein with NRDE domain
MCLIGLRIDANGDCLIAANRDEFADRPTQPLQWWDEGFLAGKDLRAGGTWLGLHRDGRFAAITNVRDPSIREAALPRASRGLLVTQYLSNVISAEDYLQELHAGLASPAPFNLLVGKLGPQPSLWWLGGRVRQIHKLSTGSHVLSNAELNTPWPKAFALKETLDQHPAASPQAKDEATKRLTNTNPAEDHQLPNTGVPLAWERRLSPAMILGKDYHTRSTTILSVVAGKAQVEETSWSPRGEPVQQVSERFLIAS